MEILIILHFTFTEVVILVDNLRLAIRRSIAGGACCHRAEVALTLGGVKASVFLGLIAITVVLFPCDRSRLGEFGERGEILRGKDAPEAFRPTTRDKRLLVGRLRGRRRRHRDGRVGRHRGGRVQRLRRPRIASSHRVDVPRHPPRIEDAVGLVDHCCGREPRQAVAAVPWTRDWDRTAVYLPLFLDRSFELRPKLWRACPLNWPQLHRRLVHRMRQPHFG